MNTPKQIASIYSEVGAGKTRMSIGRTLLLAIYSGAFIALGAYGSQVVGYGNPTGLGKMLSGLVFPVGLLMVILAGAELFTGNCLIFLSVMDGKASVKGMLKNWVLVYLGNFIGSMFVVLLLVYGHSYNTYDNGLAEVAVNAAKSKVSLTFVECLLRGILCNILVCIAVWIAIAAKDVAGKIPALFLPIVLFVVSGYEHCVANMYFLPAGILTAKEYGIAAEGLTVKAALINNMIPVTIGNIIGGAICVGFGYYILYLRDEKKNA